MTTITGSSLAKVVPDLAGLVGRTPLVELSLPGLPAESRIMAKLETLNPTGSVKDRTAWWMIDQAEQRGSLPRTGGTIVEATSGNTGISLAALSAARGHRCILVMPDNASAERRWLLAALGAEIELTDADLQFQGAIDRAEEIAAELPGSWTARQWENPDNPQAHYETTGPEIAIDTGGDVAVLVGGVGTGGTLTGTARYLKDSFEQVHVVAVDPEGSPVLTGGPGGRHAIPGLNGGFISPVTDLDCIDEVQTVSDADAEATTRLIIKSTGLLVGISSGAAVAAAWRIAEREEYRGQRIVVVLPDSADRYLSILGQGQEI
jgi:cysteine synthase A